MSHDFFSPQHQQFYPCSNHASLRNGRLIPETCYKHEYKKL